MKTYLALALVVSGALVAQLPGCLPQLECEDTGSCPPGDGDGDTGGDGGDGDGTSGGEGGDSGATGGEGGDGANPCEVCQGDTPACNEDEECVECTAEDGSACDGETSLCDASTESCVQCLGNGDCTEAAPVCDEGSCTGCTEADDCALHEDTPICNDTNGACVECLTETDCGGKVCNPSTNTCTNLDAGVLFACEECVHDAQCQDGQLCVEQIFDSTVVGNFCTWRKDGRPATVSASCFSAGKPFAGQTAEPVTSVDGTAAILCTLRTTSCPAYLQHSQAVVGCTDETPTSDMACGATDLDDGLCRENTGGDPLCTYPCGSNEDCKTSFICEIGGYCSL